MGDKSNNQGTSVTITQDKLVDLLMHTATQGNIAELRAEMKSENTSLKSEMKSDINILRSEVQSGFARADARIDKMFYFQFATILAIIGTGVGLFFKL